MRKIPFLLVVLTYQLLLTGCGGESKEKRILLFTKTKGYRHSSIAPAKNAVLKLASENGFIADTTEMDSVFTDAILNKYSAVVFINTTGDVLNHRQEIALERFIQAGGGFAGIHAASDTEYDWGWYGELVGGYFNGHPEIQNAKLRVHNKDHSATSHLDTVWLKKDEWYNFRNLDSSNKVLITIDETSYDGGTNGTYHPMSWYKEYDGGRSFYTALGHTDESYTDSVFLKHILGGINYAIGENKKLDYTKAKSQYPPDETAFSKTYLAQGEFFEPTEMTILPNLDVIIVQRRGEVLLYKETEKKIKPAGFLDVYFRKVSDSTSVEEGLLGICRDPNFSKNNFIYIFYSPTDTSVNRLSRFEFKNDSLIKSSEKIILQFYSQREICCHTGGSIAFGPDGNLYLSTGDNSTPFDEPNQKYVNRGYAPIDDRPGHEQYDARRSSANTHDLRGKVIRIKINEDGSYSIPAGNLFQQSEAGTRPEIYVMGTRNAYRISIDPKNGWLYWGDVGPDANVDSFDTRGPRGYDEINLAKSAGNYGWPLFAGYNSPYVEYDYRTGRSGKKFDALHPLNLSKNNKGLKDLPPAQTPLIWYPYDFSHDFPQLGSGGRTAMAGPVYYSDLYPKETRLPDYYNGKLFIYEFMRGWVKAATIKNDGKLWKIEPFMDTLKFAAPIDMELSHDGRLYVLQYGSGWFSKNPDAALIRIEPAGNR